MKNLKSRRSDIGSNDVDEDENEAAESFELPGADLSKEELTVFVVPPQDDEFTCTFCFLVKHISQLSPDSDPSAPLCLDCAG